MNKANIDHLAEMIFRFDKNYDYYNVMDCDISIEGIKSELETLERTEYLLDGMFSVLLEMAEYNFDGISGSDPEIKGLFDEGSKCFAGLLKTRYPFMTVSGNFFQDVSDMLEMFNLTGTALSCRPYHYYQRESKRISEHLPVASFYKEEING